jgi:hypothetical protein
MTEPEESVTLGAEHDTVLWSLLAAAITARGGLMVETSCGVGSSQEVIVYEAVLPGGRLQVTSETYVGLVLKGPAPLVRELSNEVRDA